MKMFSLEGSDSGGGTAHAQPSQEVRTTCGVVFTYRERVEEVLLTIQSIVEVAQGQLTHIDILVNGNFEVATSLRKHLQYRSERPLMFDVRVWSVEKKGKDHSWNEYVHSLWDGQSQVFFFDGYANPEQGSIARAIELLAREPYRLAISSYPLGLRTSGNLSAEAKSEGGLCGGMFLLSHQAMAQMRASGFRLPVGLYGFDTVLGAALGYGLSPERADWDVKRHIGADDGITFRILTSTVPSTRTAKHFVGRQVKSGLRRLVCAATQHYFSVLNLPISLVPTTVESYVAEWIRMKPAAFVRIAATHPIAVLALYRAFAEARRRRKNERFIRFY
jgi:hypothetical protein